MFTGPMSSSFEFLPSSCSTVDHIIKAKLLIPDVAGEAIGGLANRHILSHRPGTALHLRRSAVVNAWAPLAFNRKRCIAAVELTTADFSQECQGASGQRMATTTTSSCDLHLACDTGMLRALAGNRPAFAGSCHCGSRQADRVPLIAGN